MDRSAVTLEGAAALPGAVLPGTPDTLMGTVDVVDPAVDGNTDGDLDDLGTDIDGDGTYSDDTTCFDVNGDGNIEGPGEEAEDINKTAL